MDIQVIRLESDEELDFDSLGRDGSCSEEITNAAREIIDDIRKRGDIALSYYTEKFDHVKLETFLVPDEMIDSAERFLEASVKDALENACESIMAFHANKIPQSDLDLRPDGTLIGYRVNPLDSVGLYVPGGRASYPSTVLMNAIPAKMAGVERLVMVTPPSQNATMDPVLLYAAKLAGVDEIYAVGGAQAIAALAYGTESIEAVDKIVGPGNNYVAAAKQLVSGKVGIDLQAGPSEILILADDSANPSFVAADMLSQAEHDPDACSYLVMVGDEILEDVLSEMDRISKGSSRLEIIEESISNNGLIVICPDLASAIETANGIAPEHLEIMTDNPIELVGQLRNAGAIFVGQWTPVAMGDYIAGPSHTLPTSGAARFASPLTVDDFVKKTSVISYSYLALSDDANSVIEIANKEGFEMHSRSVMERIDLVDKLTQSGEGLN